ncbi:hypothetical protein BofuT4_P148290.1 [Botrytis cinerea T4]|uniref:Uncharacterized protein n=1 Tax=Botryotinia fuckeliana (strain T4) TaxID=999810 RepID=G2YWY1_BOTF4|nr:hypothetical protein BofuT4_P148290.1 [Botrytis cinerea T4]
MFLSRRHYLESSGMLHSVFNLDHCKHCLFPVRTFEVLPRVALYKQMSNQNLKVLINILFAHFRAQMQQLSRCITCLGPHSHNILESGCNDVTWIYQAYADWISLAIVMITVSGGIFTLLLMTSILSEYVLNQNFLCDKRHGVCLNLT